MARNEHLPVFRAAVDQALHLEKILQNYPRRFISLRGACPR